MPFLCPTQHGRVGYGLPSTERPHGTSAAENALCACQATATVLHVCAGKEMATRSHQEVWAAPNCVEPPFLSPDGCNGVSAAAKHAGAGGPGRHRRQEGAKRACEVLDK